MNSLMVIVSYAVAVVVIKLNKLNNKMIILNKMIRKLITMNNKMIINRIAKDKNKMIKNITTDTTDIKKNNEKIQI